MVEEAYVSFQTAKLLKEKGFKIDTTKDYWKIGQDGTMYFMCSIGAYTDDMNNKTAYYRPADSYPCPTQQMASRYLRENYSLHIEIEAYPHKDGCFYWHYRITELKEDILKFGYYKLYQKAGFSSPEAAIDDAHQYCLNNLI